MEKWQRKIVVGVLLVLLAAGMYAIYGRNSERDNGIQSGGMESDIYSQPESIGPDSLTSPISESQDADRLRSLPYVSWNTIEDKDSSKKGVVSYIPQKCKSGLNLFDSQPLMKACLMDMMGNILHTWSCDKGRWGTVNIDKEGNLYVVIDGAMLCKIDWHSKIIWSCKLAFHHWVSLAQNGDINSLVWDRLDITYKGRTIPIRNEYVTVLSREGTIKKRLSIYKMFGDRIPLNTLDIIYNAVYCGTSDVDQDKPDESIYDVFHTNTVEKIERDVPGLCKKGDLLVSLRNLNLIAIIDPESEKVLWSWGEGFLDMQHSPEITEKGNIIVFDNGTITRKYSRILEVEPRTRNIVFEYRSEPPESFFSPSGGTVQELGNGNMLITESERGRTFEITKSGETVWEYYSTNIEKNMRGTIHRMMRLDPVISRSIEQILTNE